MSLIRKGRRVEAAIGSTVYSDPIVKQAVKRMKQGTLSKKDFAALYSGPVHNALLEAKVKHFARHGVNKNLGVDRQIFTLQDF